MQCLSSRTGSGPEAWAFESISLPNMIQLTGKEQLGTVWSCCSHTHPSSLGHSWRVLAESRLKPGPSWTELCRTTQPCSSQTSTCSQFPCIFWVTPPSSKFRTDS